MSKITLTSLRPQARRGSSATIVALSMGSLLLFSGLAVDVGLARVNVAEMKTATSAAALSAARDLDGTAAGLTASIAAATYAANLNGLGVSDISITPGQWTANGGFVAASDPAQVNTVRVAATKSVGYSVSGLLLAQTGINLAVPSAAINTKAINPTATECTEPPVPPEAACPGDYDGDGVSDHDEGGDEVDSDGDTIPDWKDSDGNGNGIEDRDEGDDDDDDDSTPAGAACPGDYDGDGISDHDEGGDDDDDARDSDDDTIPDWKDNDSDDDDIADRDEGSDDIDGDGTPNYLDDDSDHDGIDDDHEAGDHDSDHDGVPDAKDPDEFDSCLSQLIRLVE